MKSIVKQESQIHASIEHKTLPQAGYSIHYYVSGNPTKEAIVFLHPAFGDHRCFTNQLDYFSTDYHVITVDLLGHGLSKVDKAKDKLDASVNHIQAILEKEGHAKAHIVGVSMGSLIGQYFALHHPDQTLSVTIIGGYNINKENKEVKKAQQKEFFKWLFKILFSMNSFRRYTASMAVFNPEQQANFYEMAQLYTRKSFSVMSGLDKVVQVRNNVERSFPLMIMVGEHDIELSKRQAIQWHTEDAQSHFYLVEKAGHCANMDNPARVNEQLMRFLTSATNTVQQKPV